MGAINDICDLEQLTPEEVSSTLEDRFSTDTIYTAIGSRHLLSVNPCKHVDVPRYAHLPGLTRIRDAIIGRFGTEQVVEANIVVTGESGSGKTENTKRLIAEFLSSSPEFEAGTTLLEAFGNAGTPHNSNSSRMIRTTTLRFGDDHSKVSSVQVECLLVERGRVASYKARIPQQANYHILECLAATTPGKFSIVQGTKISSEAAEFLQSLQQCATPFMTKDKWTIAISQLTGLLHLGNTSIEESDLTSEISIRQASGLLNVHAKVLGNIIGTTGDIRMGNQVLPSRQRSSADRRSVLNGLMCCIYEGVFSMVESSVNQVLNGGSGGDFRHSVRWIDLFGFENFKQNSLEQLFVNTANESLWSKFFKDLESTSAEASGSIVSQGFETRTAALDTLLCRINDVSSKSKTHAPLDALYNVLNQFQVRKNPSELSFKHYAADVTYDLSSFVDGDLESLPHEATQLLSSIGISNTPRKARSRFFRRELSGLLNSLSGDIFWILCLKPNDQLLPGSFDKKKVKAQLNAFGIEYIGLSLRGSTPIKMKIADFLRQYPTVNKEALDSILQATSFPFRLSGDRLYLSQRCVDYFDSLPVVPPRPTDDIETGPTRAFALDDQVQSLPAIPAKFVSRRKKPASTARSRPSLALNEEYDQMSIDRAAESNSKDAEVADLRNQIQQLKAELDNEKVNHQAVASALEQSSQRVVDLQDKLASTVKESNSTIRILKETSSTFKYALQSALDDVLGVFQSVDSATVRIDLPVDIERSFQALLDHNKNDTELHVFVSEWFSDLSAAVQSSITGPLQLIIIYEKLHSLMSATKCDKVLTPAQLGSQTVCQWKSLLSEQIALSRNAYQSGIVPSMTWFDTAQYRVARVEQGCNGLLSRTLAKQVMESFKASYKEVNDMELRVVDANGTWDTEARGAWVNDLEQVDAFFRTVKT